MSDRPVSDEAIEAPADASATRMVNPEFGPTHFQLKMREEQRARVMLEAAYPVIRREVAREIAARLRSDFASAVAKNAEHYGRTIPEHLAEWIEAEFGEADRALC